jgi:hypothetical protein
MKTARQEKAGAMKRRTSLNFGLVRLEPRPKRLLNQKKPDFPFGAAGDDSPPRRGSAPGLGGLPPGRTFERPPGAGKINAKFVAAPDAEAFPAAGRRFQKAPGRI